MKKLKKTIYYACQKLCLLESPFLFTFLMIRNQVMCFVSGTLVDLFLLFKVDELLGGKRRMLYVRMQCMQGWLSFLEIIVSMGRRMMLFERMKL